MRRSFDLLLGCVFIEHQRNAVRLCESFEVIIVTDIANVPKFKLIYALAEIKSICADIFGIGIELDIPGNAAKIECV